MYNLYIKNRTDDLGGKSEEVMDFYIPIGVILVELQDCPNNLAGIGSNNIHVIGPDSNNRISVYAIEVLTASDGESK
jgi:hypothetical protein